LSSPSRRLFGRAGAVVGALLAIAVPVGCGSGSHTTSTATSHNATVPAANATGASASGTSAGTSGKTSAAHAAPTTATSAGAASTPAPAAPSTSGRLLRRFAGEGNGRLGTIVVSARSLLVWNAHHAGIQIFTSTGFMLVNSRSVTGTVRLSRGTYHGVRVSSAGRWLVELRSSPS
jgi:hypothetical protein